MIDGWEEFTVELTEKDKPIVDLVIKGLKAHVGKDRAVSNAKIRKALRDRYQMKVADAQVRKIVQYIRQENRVERLCSNSHGYYVAKDDKELDEWAHSMRQRTRSMEYTLQCVINPQKNIE